jgi:hypothetical protein
VISSARHEVVINVDACKAMTGGRAQPRSAFPSSSRSQAKFTAVRRASSRHVPRSRQFGLTSAPIHRPANPLIRGDDGQIKDGYSINANASERAEPGPGVFNGPFQIRARL